MTNEAFDSIVSNAGTEDSALTGLNDVVEDIMKNICQEDVEFFSEEPNTHAKIYATREIRNQYRLWHDSPLTKDWREGKRLIVLGVDCSVDHPDAVSAVIFEEVVRRCKELKNASLS